MTPGAYLLQLQRQNPSGEIVHMLVLELNEDITSVSSVTLLVV